MTDRFQTTGLPTRLSRNTMESLKTGEMATDQGAVARVKRSGGQGFVVAFSCKGRGV